MDISHSREHQKRIEQTDGVRTVNLLLCKTNVYGRNQRCVHMVKQHSSNVKCE